MTGDMDARRHSLSDRLLGLTPYGPPLCGDPADAADFDERDVFWSGDSGGGSGGDQSDPPRLSRIASGGGVRRAPVKQGILAALFEDDEEEGARPLHRRVAAAGSPSWTAIPAIPRPPREVWFSQSLPAERFCQSAPRRVPITAAKLGKPEMGGGGGGLVDGSDEEEGDQMLPPHEIVARRSSAASPFTTFSVLEGQGRTLKGRDLRRVRNAVLTRTGFLD